jgi:hypothetical protein
VTLSRIVPGGLIMSRSTMEVLTCYFRAHMQRQCLTEHLEGGSIRTAVHVIVFALSITRIVLSKE